MKIKLILLLFFASISIMINAQDKYALVIGNNKYSGQIAPLRASVKDAEDIANAFRRLGYKTTLLTNLERGAMIDSLNEFKKASSGALEVVFYYSGHAGWKEDTYYIIPSGEYKDIDLSLADKCYQYKSIENIISRINAPLKIIFIDACQNSFDNVKGIVSPRKDAYKNNITKAKGLICFFASSIGEYAKEDANREHGIFTKALLNHLGDYGTFDIVWDYICDEVLMENQAQTPTYHQRPDDLIKNIKFNPQKISYDSDNLIIGKQNLKFSVLPLNATIKIDDKILTSGQNILLNFGNKYEYEITADGYDTYKNSFTFKPEMQFIKHSLTKLEPATLTLTSNVHGIQVNFDGKPIKNLPYTIKTYSGTHKITASKKKYRTIYNTLKLNSGNNQYNLLMQKEMPWFWSYIIDWDDDEMLSISYHYSPKYQIGLSGMYRFNNSRFSIGAIIAASPALFKDLSNEIEVYTSGSTTIETTITDNLGNKITLKEEHIVIDGGNEAYSDLIDPYNEAKHYDATAILLLNSGYNLCNSFMLEAGVGFGYHQDRYHMSNTYIATKVVTSNSATGEITETPYEYNMQPKSKWYKENDKFSPAIRLGARFFVPFAEYSDSHFSFGGGYTHLTSNKEHSSWDINIGISLIW